MHSGEKYPFSEDLKLLGKICCRRLSSAQLLTVICVSWVSFSFLFVKCSGKICHSCNGLKQGNVKQVLCHLCQTQTHCWFRQVPLSIAKVF